MNEALINKKHVLKFRQWSGKNYAVFASIGKEVNIGHVDIDICDKASEKSNQTKSLIITKSECLTEEIINEEESGEENLESQLITMLSITSNLDTSPQHCCNSITKYIINFYQEGVRKVLVKLSASFVRLCGIMTKYCYTEFHKPACQQGRADSNQPAGMAGLHKVKKE